MQLVNLNKLDNLLETFIHCIAALQAHIFFRKSGLVFLPATY